jgi:hypothetical protein
MIHEIRKQKWLLKATFNNIWVISWRSVSLVEETGVPGENHRPASSHRQTLSQNVVSNTPRYHLVHVYIWNICIHIIPLLNLPSLSISDSATCTNVVKHIMFSPILYCAQVKYRYNEVLPNSEYFLNVCEWI